MVDNQQFIEAFTPIPTLMSTIPIIKIFKVASIKNFNSSATTYPKQYTMLFPLGHSNTFKCDCFGITAAAFVMDGGKKRDKTNKGTFFFPFFPHQNFFVTGKTYFWLWGWKNNNLAFPFYFGIPLI